ncbi:MAG: preprotein translocase subunit YajC [Cytophagaceae bacterium]
MNFNILLQAQGEGNPFSMFIMLGLIFVIFYFFMMRPQQKKAKEHKTFRDSVKKGDTVVTIGGVHGKVASVETDDTVILEVDKGVKMKFEKSAISADASKKYAGTNSSNE